MKKNLSDLPLLFQIPRAFYVSFFAIMPHLQVTAMVRELLKISGILTQRTMLLEVERLDEECDNLEQRVKLRMDFYIEMVLKQ